MEATTNFRILELISRVYEKSKNLSLKDIIHNLDNELGLLAKYFEINKTQALFLSVIFALNYDKQEVNLIDLKNHFNWKTLKILQFMSDLELLYKRSFIKKKSSYFSNDLTFSNEYFVVESNIVKSVIKGEPILIEDCKIEDPFDLLGKINEVYDLCYEDQFSINWLEKEVEDLISRNLHLPLVSYIKNLNLDKVNSFLYLYIIWQTVLGSSKVNLSRTLTTIYDKPQIAARNFQSFISGKNELVIKRLIDYDLGNLLDDVCIFLTKKEKRKLKTLGLEVLSDNNSRLSLIQPNSIIEKHLYYNPKCSNNLSMLENVLKEENLKPILSKLEKKKLPKGFCCLLYGPPGIGKTEFVKQLARSSKRALLKQDISSSKSCWYGESEKNIKRIFDDYRELCEECELTPILFFNEADALISKRQDISHSRVGQTENSIQNILLEELENFEGIFIATTNLVENFDVAFERRFIFKIGIEQPDKETKFNIWKSNLPILSDETCRIVSERFDFSGGEINNIVRKCNIHEIISGAVITYEQLIAFCENERIVPKYRNSIGYSKC